MRIAILDLGTNTFNIFIADLFPFKEANGLPEHTKKGWWVDFKKLYKSKIAVKLGEGGINNNVIAEEPFSRGISALKMHKNRIEEFGVDKVIAVATSAIRSASNGMDFIRSAKEKAGIEVQVISGDREAELIYYGVRSAVNMNNTPSLIIDIGGGSTELIIGTKKEALWKQSFLLGAARLIEQFHPSDPITKEEIQQIEHHLEHNLQPLYEAIQKYPVTELIGSSGSFDSLAEMIGYRFYDTNILKGKTEYDFNLDDCEKIYEMLRKSTTEERLNMKGLVRMRVDMIVVSVIFICFIMQRLNLKKMRLSTYSLKEGVLWELIHS